MNKLYNNDCLDIHYKIKEYFKYHAINVLNNENNQSISDFINLIYNNI